MSLQPHFELLYNHRRRKNGESFLFIYGLYVSDKKHSFKLNMNMTQNYTLIYYKADQR